MKNEIGERGRNRTCDPRIKSAMLYRLSYAPRTIASIRHCSTNCCKRKIRKTLAHKPCLKRALLYQLSYAPAFTSIYQKHQELTGILRNFGSLLESAGVCSGVSWPIRLPARRQLFDSS